MVDMYRASVSVLKSYEKVFNNELNYFNNTTYNTFSSSYLKNCSDSYVQRMASSLDSLYGKIKKGYQNIDDWWTSYNENIEALENYLSDNGNIGAISEDSIRNTANGMPVLRKFDLLFAGIVPPAVASSNSNTLFANNEVISASNIFNSLFSEYDVANVNANTVISNNNIIGWVNEIGSNVSNNSKNLWADSTNWRNDAENWWETFALPILAKANSIVDNTIKSVGAKYGSFAESLLNNTLKIGKLVISTAAISSLGPKIEEKNTGVIDFLGEAGCKVADTAQSMLVEFIDWKDDTINQLEESAIHVIEEAGVVVGNVIKSSLATFATFELSLVEGVGKLGESLIDTCALLGTGVATLVTGLGDITVSLFTGENNWRFTKDIWNQTKSFVSNQYVNGWFDSFYENNVIGQFIKENAIGFSGLRSIVTGVSYIASVVVLTICTAGFGAASATASASGSAVTVATAAASTTAGHIAVGTAVAGLGKNVEKAWIDGAGIGEGLAAGSLLSIWEGVQSFIGAKVSNLNMFGKEGLIKALTASETKTKVMNSISRVIIDGIDGGSESIVLAVIDSIYKDGYYDENGEYFEFLEDETIWERYGKIFDDNGGWAAFLTEAVIGSASSVIGEAFDLRKYFKDAQVGDAKAEIPVKVSNRIMRGDIDLVERINTLSKFMHTMLNDNKSDPDCVKLMHDTFEKAFDEGNLEAFYVLKMFNNLKEKNPDLKIIVDSSFKNCCWIQENSLIVITNKSLNMGDSGTLIHEFGHCLFDSILDGKLPDNWDKIIRKAKKKSSNSNKFLGWIEKLQDISRQTEDIAMKTYEKQLQDNMGYSLEEYKRVLSNQYNKMLNELSVDDLEIKLKLMGYDDELIKSVIDEDILPSDMADIEIRNAIGVIKDKISRTQFSDYRAISDIIDAVYEGNRKDLKGNKFQLPYIHGSEYYLKREKNAPLHEMIANFTQLKITGNESSLNALKDIFGDEFYNTLNDIFSQFGYDG